MTGKRNLRLSVDNNGHPGSHSKTLQNDNTHRKPGNPGKMVLNLEKLGRLQVFYMLPLA